jgi:hypothetical protein
MFGFSFVILQAKQFPNVKENFLQFIFHVGLTFSIVLLDHPTVDRFKNVIVESFLDRKLNLQNLLTIVYRYVIFSDVER